MKRFMEKRQIVGLEPNQLTKETLEKSERGEDLHKVDSVEELMEDLESERTIKMSKKNRIEKRGEGKELNFKNISYGQLVDYLMYSGGIACSCKVHFFNHKGVLVGRYYEFVPYNKIRQHPLGRVWEGEWSVKGQYICQWFYEVICRVVTVLMRWTQRKN